ncbi:MAG: hypothetical protein ABSB66_04755 [Candidatus Acidiferrales bacterium]|jgi:hypothetical protein
MNKNTIAAEDARLLFDKLISENVPVIAFFRSTTGMKVLMSGFVDSVTDKNGVVLTASKPVLKASGFMSVPTFGRDVEFSYCDAREMPVAMAGVSTKIGNTVLLLNFVEPLESLFLTFDS